MIFNGEGRLLDVYCHLIWNMSASFHPGARVGMERRRPKKTTLRKAEIHFFFQGKFLRYFFEISEVYQSLIFSSNEWHTVNANTTASCSTIWNWLIDEKGEIWLLEVRILLNSTVRPKTAALTQSKIWQKSLESTEKSALQSRSIVVWLAHV